MAARYQDLTIEEIKHQARLGFDWVAYWHLGDDNRATASAHDLRQEGILLNKLREAGYDL